MPFPVTLQHFEPTRWKFWGLSGTDALVGEGEAIYHTAGVLGKGEKIWILAKLPDYVRVNGDDLVEKYLLLMNSHDGSGPVRVKLTPIRVVCENTLAMALNGGEQEVHIRHTQNAQAKLEKAHEVLGLSNHLYGQLETIFNQMGKKHLSRQQRIAYIEKVFPLPEENNPRGSVAGIRAKLFELEEIGKGAEMVRGTLWGSYNAVTEYVDHFRLPKANPSARLKSIWLGTGEGIKKAATKPHFNKMTGSSKILLPFFTITAMRWTCKRGN